MLDFPRKPDIITFVLTREQNKKPRAQNKIAGLCKGSTTDSDSVCEGSNPSPAAKVETAETVATQQFRRFSFIRFPVAPAENLTLLGQLAGGNGGGKFKYSRHYVIYEYLLRCFIKVQHPKILCSVVGNLKKTGRPKSAAPIFTKRNRFGSIHRMTYKGTLS